MGLFTALQFRESDLSIEQQIELHLTTNCYPPVTPTLVPSCVEAINSVLSGDENALIELPSDVTYKNQTSAPAIEFINTFRLEAWLIELSDLD